MDKKLIIKRSLSKIGIFIFIMLIVAFILFCSLYFSISFQIFANKYWWSISIIGSIVGVIGMILAEHITDKYLPKR